MAPYIIMIASTVIAEMVLGWISIGAPIVLNLLPNYSVAGIGVLKTDLKVS